MHIKTMELVFLVILLPVTLSAKNSLTYFLTTTSGIQTVPDFMIVVALDEVEGGYCGSKNLTAEPRQDWVQNLLKDDPGHLEWNTQNCRAYYEAHKVMINNTKHQLNQVGGVHVIQEIFGCDWDDDIKEFIGYHEFGYDGEDFISLDLKKLTWVFTEKAAIFRNKWDGVYRNIKDDNIFLTNICPERMKLYLKYGNSSLQRKVPPSVSLLQKTPSSPVSCHATGFYPDRADMFWRKDGEETHEDVDYGEIFPNNDGTFQISVELDLSSVKPEDWSSYDCVFQLSGVEDDIVNKLDKAVIRTNWVARLPEKPRNTTIAISVTVVVLLLVLSAATGFMFYKKKKVTCLPAPPAGSERFQ